MSCPCTGTPPCWVCAPLTPDRRPYVPPVPATPAERVQGEAGEVAE